MKPYTKEIREACGKLEWDLPMIKVKGETKEGKLESIQQIEDELYDEWAKFSCHTETEAKHEWCKRAFKLINDHMEKLREEVEQ